MVGVDKAVVARIQRAGNTFEVLVDCDAALEMRSGKSIGLSSVLAADKVFSDARRGLLAGEQQMEAAFGTQDTDAVAREIIMKGEVQVTAEHRNRLREQRKRRIIETIHKNGVDPRTMLPHPVSRIELALEEAKVRIDDHRSIEDEVARIVKLLRPVLPIRFEKVRVRARIGAVHAARAYSAARSLGRIVRDEWQNDGSWLGVIEVAAANQPELFDKIGKISGGEAELTILKEGEQ